MKKQKIKKALYWVLTSLVSLVLIASALGKFIKAEGQIKNAENWNIPYELLYVIALVEILIVVMLLMRRIKYGVGLLIVLMIGAMGTHLTHNEAQFTIINVILIGFASGIFFTGKVFDQKISSNE